MLSKKCAKVDWKICVACGACMKECPKAAVTVWKGCHAVVEEVKCIGCGKCVRICPTSCITTVKREVL